MTYTFIAENEAWHDSETGVPRAPLKVVFTGCGETVDQVLADFKDWMMAVGYSQNIAHDVVYSPQSLENFINETKREKK